MQVAETPHTTRHARVSVHFSRKAWRGSGSRQPSKCFLPSSTRRFYVGPVDFLFNANHTVAYTLLALVSFSVLVYLLLTVIPLYYHNSLYQTPLTSPVWFVMEAAPLFVLWLRPRTNAVKKAIYERLAKMKHGMCHSLEM